MHYVYLLESQSHPGQRYIGVAADLKLRIAEHNGGKPRHTAKVRPWKLVAYVAFDSRRRAEDFESYLKSGSGHAFANKRLWPGSIGPAVASKD